MPAVTNSRNLKVYQIPSNLGRICMDYLVLDIFYLFLIIRDAINIKTVASNKEVPQIMVPVNNVWDYNTMRKPLG